MSLLFVTHDRYLDHVAGPGHPERPARLSAIVTGIERAGLRDAITPIDAPTAPVEAVTQVHAEDVVALVERLAERGGGRIDADTAASVCTAANAGWSAVSARVRETMPKVSCGVLFGRACG